MLDLMKTLEDTPVPTILVVAGILFILLAIAGQFEIKILKIPPLASLWQRLFAGIGGTSFLIVGLLIYLLPISPLGITHLSPGTSTVVPSPMLTTAPSPTPTLDPSTAVKDLMDQEVSAAKSRDLKLVDQIYASDAVVKEAVCQPGDQSHIWYGREQIKARYRDLPQFLSLAHANKQVTLIPNDPSAMKATATASTQGQFVMVASGSTQKLVSLGGNEQWEFSKIADQWFITIFTYNLC
jgi:hypothetical protein